MIEWNTLFRHNSSALFKIAKKKLVKYSYLIAGNKKKKGFIGLHSNCKADTITIYRQKNKFLLLILANIYGFYIVLNWCIFCKFSRT